MTTHTVASADAVLVYDVDVAGGRPLFMAGQHMDASGFAELAACFPERTVVRYDPRGRGRSVCGHAGSAPAAQARDVHEVVQALGGGPVDMFAAGGGAITALALVAAFPGDVATLVAHEPPLAALLPDASAAFRAFTGCMEVYERKGYGAGMAAFLTMAGWRGEFTEEYFALPPADPARFGLPVEDDGGRDDPLLSDRSTGVGDFRPDVTALRAAPTRVVVAVGEDSIETFTGRAAVATAAALGQEALRFPGGHHGFRGAGAPAFATALRAALDAGEAKRPT
ncbi:alpha/beta fold hydrolase [Nonomuraea soli]|uniref:Pimeloyl-ACP methyl ester carboxylesterase n=1 Tax=Nonomuraea soli TaxID=1032476 RepID=A0A7W0HPK3_9ACTN|nr:alpha/beta hydrolase [Nonomuraea soli]MBA2890842.1 pimeloyl-ACP methyl ester carboxylesterase [Nonomuraea soli]